MTLYLWGVGGSAEMFRYCINCIDKAYGGDSFEYDGLIDRDGEELSIRLGFKVLSPLEINWSEKPKVILTMENPGAIFSYLEGYGYKINIDFWTASSYLFHYFSLKKYGNEEDLSIMRSVIVNCFGYNKSRIKRTWMLSEIVFEYLFMNCFKIDQEFIDLIFRQTSFYKSTNRAVVGEMHKCMNLRGLSICSSEYMSLYKKNVSYLLSKIKIDSIYLDCILYYKAVYMIAPGVYILFNNEEVFLVSNPFISEAFLYFKDLTLPENRMFCNCVEHMFRKRVMKQLFGIICDRNNGQLTNEEILRLKSIYPESEECDYLSAVLLTKERNDEEAIRVLEGCLEKRGLHERINLLLADLEKKKGEYIKAIKHYSRAMVKSSNKDQLWMLDNNGGINAEKKVKDGIVDCIIKYSQGDDNREKECMKAFSEEILVDRRRFSDKELVYDKGKIKAIDLSSTYPKRLFYDDGSMDLLGGIKDNSIEYIEAELTKMVTLDAYSNKNCLLSVMRIQAQDLIIEYKGKKVVYKANNDITSEIGKMVNRFMIGKWTNLKISDKITISSDSNFAISKPFVLKQNDVRPRIILNIFVDALAYDRIRSNLGKYMPNTKKFFEKGCIFDNCYSVGEWTQTNYPSMFLGIRSSRLNAFHPRICCKAENKYKSIIQFARDKGYYCCEYVSDSADIKRFYRMGPTKGYHRQIVENRMPIEKAINSIIISDEYDLKNLYTIHCLDVHDNHFDNGENSTMYVDTSKLDFEVVEMSDSYTGESPWSIEQAYLSRNEVFLEGIRQFDEKLGALYDYLTRTYADDEMFVSLFSDHGAFGAPYKLDRTHTRTALMTRGYMTPQIGVVDTEIISNMDLFSIYQKILGFEINYDIDSSVPKIYGGPGRKYSISEWRYPGQPCRIAVNTIHKEMIIESVENTTYDGRVDFDNSTCILLLHGLGIENDMDLDVSIDDICLEYIKEYDW